MIRHINLTVISRGGGLSCITLHKNSSMEHKALWYHVTAGFTTPTVKDFNNTISYILEQHGVEDYTIIEENV